MTEDNITEADAWPLDVSKLNKGDVLDEAQIQRITGISAFHPRYPFELMQLREHIMRESAVRNSPLSVAIRGNALVINTDAQASAYHAGLAKQGERQVHRHFFHLMRTVDAGKLTVQERSEHERRIQIWAMKASRLKGKAIGADPKAIETEAP